MNKVASPLANAALRWVAPVLLLGAPTSAQQRLTTGQDVRVAIDAGRPLAVRPFPPRIGRNRCIKMDGIAGAQLFSDRAIEITMRDGRHFRMFFARECPALSFYQGFYYRRARAGQLCAGRDAIGARSGGECPIASIIAVRQQPPPRKQQGPSRK